MDPILPHSWQLLLLLALAALALALRPATALVSLARTPRYFRHLVAVSRNGRDDVTAYHEVSRPIALALGYEFVDTFRAYRGSGRHLRLDLWRGRDGDTLAMVGVSHFLWWHYPRTVLVSVLVDGRRVTTTDNFDEGDPRGVKGEAVRPGAGFRELHTRHRELIRASAARPEAIGFSNPLSVIEDLERQRVQALADAGIARFRGETENAWSYTWRGAFEVYYRARPRQVRVWRAGLAAQQEETAK